MGLRFVVLPKPIPPHTHSVISSLSSSFLASSLLSLYLFPPLSITLCPSLALPPSLSLSPSPKRHTSSKLQFLSSGVVFTVVVVVVVEVVVVVLYPLTRPTRLGVRYNSKFSTSSTSFGRRGLVVVLVDFCCSRWRSFCCEAAQATVVDICLDDDRRSSCGPWRTSERVVVEVMN